jgi:hypothetical protein
LCLLCPAEQVIPLHAPHLSNHSNYHRSVIHLIRLERAKKIWPEGTVCFHIIIIILFYYFRSLNT